MKRDIEKRAIESGKYIVKNNATVRNTAKHFAVSKSTVHKDVAERLEKADRELFLKVKKVLSKNKEERHIRGGIATREKYRKMREKTCKLK